MFLERVSQEIVVNSDEVKRGEIIFLLNGISCNHSFNSMANTLTAHKAIDTGSTVWERMTCG